MLQMRAAREIPIDIQPLMSAFLDFCNARSAPIFADSAIFPEAFASLLAESAVDCED